MLEETVRLLLIDDHPLVRDGLRTRLETCHRFKVVGEAGNASQAIAEAEASGAQIAIMDIGMRNTNGIELTRIFHERFPHVRVLILSMYDNPEYVAEAVRAGAKGYVLKDCPANEIIAAIDAVVAGGNFYSAGAAAALDRMTPTATSLTAREKEVLMLIVEGQSNKQIARRLNLSVRTVETHRLNMKHKLGVDSAAGLVRFAMERGWTKL
jgi:DNA-binding NarL/FixJ family response regulator